jgi:8-oxoguanine deaminase
VSRLGTHVATLLIKNALLVATMDEDERELAGCDVLVDGPAIAEVGPGLEATADETINATDCVVLPGFVNTHNHCFQALYRSIPEVLDVNFVEWITFLTNLWLREPFSPDAVYSAALVNFGELLLTGCTATADQHYVYPSQQPSTFVDRTIDAARDAGIRFHPARGCLTLGRSRGGLVPDEFTQPEDVVLRHSQDLIERYHDPGDYAMTRLVLAPLGLYSDTEAIYREMRALAAEHSGVHCHTHLYEIADAEFSEANYGMRPLEFMERVGWAGDDVLFYHVVAPQPTQAEVLRLAQTGSFVSHCVASDMRLGYGLTPMRELIDAGANVCLGTTGVASNMGADMLLEAKLCLLAHRLRGDERLWLTAREVLRLATKEGARGLGRDDLGSLEPGKCADLAIFDLNRIDMSGHHDPLAALLFQGISHQTKATIVNGKVVARDGVLLGFDQEEATRRANDWARRLVAK